METNEIIRQIMKLPVEKQLLIAEKTLHSVRKREKLIQIEETAQNLISEYKTNEELTSFLALDPEVFYETR